MDFFVCTKNLRTFLAKIEDKYMFRPSIKKAYPFDSIDDAREAVRDHMRDEYVIASFLPVLNEGQEND
jgi:hypothetical protein